MFISDEIGNVELKDEERYFLPRVAQLNYVTVLAWVTKSVTFLKQYVTKTERQYFHLT